MGWRYGPLFLVVEAVILREHAWRFLFEIPLFVACGSVFGIETLFLLPKQNDILCKLYLWLSVLSLLGLYMHHQEP